MIKKCSKKRSPLWVAFLSLKTFLTALSALFFFKTKIHTEIKAPVSVAIVKKTKGKSKKRNGNKVGLLSDLKTETPPKTLPERPQPRTELTQQQTVVPSIQPETPKRNKLSNEPNPKQKKTTHKTAPLQTVSLGLPVQNARMSSQFGYRTHPILKTKKLHKGMDFAAKVGTPIYAAADGKVEVARYSGSYGHYIRLKHLDGTIKTAYAHLSRYGKGLKEGKVVKRNQIIGYVGTTGRSTGPHLHFEMIKNGKHVDPKNYMI